MDTAFRIDSDKSGYLGSRWSRSHTLGRAHGRICPRDGVPPSPSSPRRPSPSASPPGGHPVPPPRPHRRGRPPSADVAALPGPVAAGQPAGRRPPRADDARGEDRPDDAGRARQRSTPTPPRSPPTTSAACCPAVARCRPRTRPTAWADMVDRYQAAALNTRLGIPLIYGIDTVHGDGNMDGATVFPHNIGLGATRDPALVRERRARRRVGDALERPAVGLRPLHLRGTRRPLGPHLRVVRRDAGARGEDGDRDRRFPGPARVTSPTTTGCSPPPSTSPATASRRTAPAPTSGSTGNYPIDQGVDQVNHATFRRLALAPYVPAVKKHHVGSVMPSYSDVDWTEDGLGNRINMHGNRRPDQRLAEGPAGLQRVRDLRLQRHRPHRPGHRHLRPAGRRRASTPASTCSCSPRTSSSSSRRSTSLVNDGTVPMARIDDAVSRILTKKFQLGLFEHPYTDRTHLSEIGDAAHHAVARRAVAESQVLLKNERATLPIRGLTGRCTSPAATPTTSATRPAAGPSPGRAARRT